jgi:hypothetical protein
MRSITSFLKSARNRTNNKADNFLNVSMTKKQKRVSPMYRWCKRIPPNMILSYKNSLRQMWDAVPMMLSIYNALVIPYYFSFGLTYDFLQVESSIDYVVDALFIIDNFLMFFTTY